MEEFAPKPHTIALMMSARTERIRPTVMTALRGETPVRKDVAIGAPQNWK